MHHVSSFSAKGKSTRPKKPTVSRTILRRTSMLWIAAYYNIFQKAQNERLSGLAKVNVDY